MKVRLPCEHGQLSPHKDRKIELRCIHWPAEHIADCGTARWQVIEGDGEFCPGGPNVDGEEMWWCKAANRCSPIVTGWWREQCIPAYEDKYVTREAPHHIECGVAVVARWPE